MPDDLEKVSGIGKATADRLRSAGVDTVEKLAVSKLEDLLKIKGILKANATKYIENAKKLIEKKAVKDGSEPEKEAEAIQKEVPSKVIETGSEKVTTKKEAEKKPKAEEKEELLTTEAEQKEEQNIKKLLKQQAECNIGTVGHVDHGKTTFVQALSGEWTDRHSEERERGISIKLGYSNTSIFYCPKCDMYLTDYMAEKERKKGQPRYLCPTCGGQLIFKRNISFVDSPGHEILMATMLSGASLMNGACLLIAANETCPQPQTREHLAALNIAGIKNIVIIQNKIDAVPRDSVIKNYQQIKTFVKGTVAQDAPVIPISAVFGANLDVVIRAFEEIIPTPQIDEKENFQFLIARSFDINRPGKEIEELKGGVIGGSVLKGKITIGEKIEIRPGLRVKNQYMPITTTVVSISQGSNSFDEAKPGGLIGLGTTLDPALTKGDALIGHLVGKPGTLPDTISEVQLKIKLLDRVIGSEDQEKVQTLKHNEKLLLVVGTEKTAGTVFKIFKDSYIVKLTPPICPPEKFIYALSRIVNRRYRLIGYGTPVN